MGGRCPPTCGAEGWTKAPLSATAPTAVHGDGRDAGSKLALDGSGGCRTNHIPNTQGTVKLLSPGENLSPPALAFEQLLSEQIRPKLLLPPAQGLGEVRNTLHAPTAVSWFMDKTTAKRLWLQTAPSGAVKIYPAFPVLKGNTHANGDRCLGEVQKPGGGGGYDPVIRSSYGGLRPSISGWLSEDKPGMIIHLAQPRNCLAPPQSHPHAQPTTNHICGICVPGH